MPFFYLSQNTQFQNININKFKIQASRNQSFLKGHFIASDQLEKVELTAYPKC